MPSDLSPKLHGGILRDKVLRRMAPHAPLLLAISTSVALAYVFLRYRLSSTPTRSLEATQGPSTLVDSFWLIVEVTFKSEADVKTFEAAWRPVAEYCRAHEPNTLSYQMARSDKEPFKIVMLERYKTKKDYLEVHRSSEAFLKFKPQLLALEPVITGHSYLESSIGYV
jgi:quinol monooxygenase YgiN